MKEEPVNKRSFFSKVFGTKQSEPKEPNPVILNYAQIPESKPQDEEELADEMAVSKFVKADELRS